jgi:hypothetical protein
MLSFQHHEWLPKREVFKKRAATTAEESEDRTCLK